MTESTGKGVLIEPVELQPAPPPKEVPPRRKGPWLFLMVVLTASAWGLFQWFADSEEPGPEIAAPVEAPPTSTPAEHVPEEMAPDLTTDTPEPSVPVLTLLSDPPGASVIMGGLFQGVTPLELEAWKEGAPVEFRLTGFAPVRETFPPEGSSATLKVTLNVEVAAVRFSGEVEGAILRVDEQVMALPDSRVLTLPVRETVIRFEKPGFAPWQQTVTPTQAYQREVRVSFRPLQEATEAVDSPAEAQASSEPVIRNTLGIDLVLMPVPLEGTIGAPRGTPGRKSQEAVRQVRLTRPFRLAATEVSNAQFAQFDPSHSSGRAGAIALSAPDLPVVNVRWEQAVQFCNWLSLQEGLPPAYIEKDGRWHFAPNPGTGYRLPTEAEWEMTVRRQAGDALYAWGDQVPPPKNTVNLAGKESVRAVSSVLPGYQDGSSGPVVVQAAYPGPERILGLSGNVREWVHDGFSAPSPGQGIAIDPMGKGGARFHVMKGAGWRDAGWMNLRIAKRDYGDQLADDLGFRVARYVIP